MRALVGVVTLSLSLPGASSLKEKRSRLRPLLEGIRNKFQVSVAEIGRNDSRDRSVIAAAVVGNDSAHLNSVLAKIADASAGFDVRLDDVETEIV